MDRSMLIPILALVVASACLACNVFVVHKMGGWSLLWRGLRDFFQGSDTHHFDR